MLDVLILSVSLTNRVRQSKYDERLQSFNPLAERVDDPVVTVINGHLERLYHMRTLLHTQEQLDKHS